MARRLVSQADIDTFTRLRAEGLTNLQISDRTGWAQGTVQDYTSQRRTIPTPRLHDPEKYQGAYQAPSRVANDDGKHRRLLAQAFAKRGLEGFPDAFAHRAPRARRLSSGREFWRG